MSSRMRPTIIFGGIDGDVPQSGMTARTKEFSRTVFVRALLQRLDARAASLRARTNDAGREVGQLDLRLSLADLQSRRIQLEA